MEEAHRQERRARSVNLGTTTSAFAPDDEYRSPTSNSEGFLNVVFLRLATKLGISAFPGLVNLYSLPKENLKAQRR